MRAVPKKIGMKDCFFCQRRYIDYGTGITANVKCSKRRTLEFCEDYLIKPEWEIKRERNALKTSCE
jgi:hypothetical protein